jgi:hypothetical protein
LEEGILNSSNKGDCPSPIGDNSKRVKTHCIFLRIFFSRIDRPISIKLGSNHPWLNGIFNFFSNKGLGPIQRGR